MKRLTFISMLLFVLSFSNLAGENLVIFHAGSLTVPLKKMKIAFEKEHPEVNIQLEASGSRLAARKIADLHRKADIVASADYRVINNLLIPKYASWNILFATNAMVIAYNDKSKYADSLNGNNWSRFFIEKGVRYAHADPNIDPCGYRTLMVWQLEGKRLENPALYDSLNAHCPRENVRPKSVELLALLESGEFDYIFEYESVAKQHNLRYITLNDSVNLSRNSLSDFYSKAIVNVSGKKPGEYIAIKGAPIVYGITIPNNAPHEKLAEAFLKFIISSKGKAILSSCGQTPLRQVKIEGDTSYFPNALKSYLLKQ
ncbi:MAG: tungstate ABC transporter substrate-binding protein WtpA [Proteobacteria bacterium]|nr:tungstate ABC transporter substrate-binding protein WtpA [Pseudomonadota bacterium]